MLRNTHAKFVQMTSDGEWEAYVIGRTMANRFHWMSRARRYVADGNKPAAAINVQAARNENHAYLRALKHFRESKITTLRVPDGSGATEVAKSLCQCRFDSAPTLANPVGQPS